MLLTQTFLFLDLPRKRSFNKHATRAVENQKFTHLGKGNAELEQHDSSEA